MDVLREVPGDELMFVATEVTGSHTDVGGKSLPPRTTAQIRLFWYFHITKRKLLTIVVLPTVTFEQSPRDHDDAFIQPNTFVGCQNDMSTPRPLGLDMFIIGT